MNLVIRAVTMATRHHFAELLTEASAWQKTQGSEGWTYPFNDEWMIPRIERCEIFLAEIAGSPVAAMRILWEDRFYWDDREQGDSIYLHTFAVKRSMGGLGIGGIIIEHLVELGRSHARSKIRLDCSLSSARLISYYERHGFRSVGSKFVSNKMMNLMERDIQTQTTDLGSTHD